MRPRPDAAENASSREQAFGFLVASMRPRPDAAENLPVQMGGSPFFIALQ